MAQHITTPVAFVSSHAKLGGGAERYLERLLSGLRTTTPCGVVLLENGPFVAAIERLGYPATVIHTSGKPADILLKTFPLRRALLSSNARVVHANGIKAALMSAVATAGTSLPVVWVKHDFSGDPMLARAVAARCALVVGVSSAVVSALPSSAADRVRVVHSGVDLARIDAIAARRALEDALGLPPSTSVLAVFGRLHPNKGQLEVVEIAALLRLRFPDLAIIFFGAPDPSVPGYADTLRARAAELGVDDMIILAGYRPDAATLVAGCDVVAVPSLAVGSERDVEGFGLAALEALAAGTPVVAYASGGLPEVLGDDGMLVPPGDRPALLGAISELLLDPALRKRLGARGRKRVTDRFTPERWVSGLEGCYAEVLSRG
jgi:glycosyltransferase involved in cell wall biosynthesis